MGIPGWAIPLGLAIKGPEIANDWMGLFKGIREGKAAEANEQAARDSVDNLAWAAQEEDPAVRLANFREVSRDMSGRPLNANTLLSLQKEVDTQAKGTLADVKAVEQQNQLAAFQREAADSGKDIFTYGLERPDRIPMGALQGVHNVLQTFAVGAGKEIDRREKEQKELARQENIAGFQSAIGGLVAPSQSPTDLKRFASNGGYAPISEIESDIRQAAASYGVGDSDEVNKAITGARETYKNTYLPTETGKVGRTSYTGQRNLLGDFRKDAQSVAPVIKVTVPGGHGDTGGGDDIPAWGRAIMEGRANLQDVPARGTIRSQVVKWIESGGGTDYQGNRAENSAYSSSLTQQQKQLGSMGSFVRNLSSQIDRVGKLGAELYTADSRLLNIPIRAIRGRIAGSPNQAKYDMYLAEIESEIGKLSTGSTGSVAELSAGAQERWAKIHDKNLSLADMLELLKETKHAGELRMQSVKDQLEDTRKERKERIGGAKGEKAEKPATPTLAAWLPAARAANPKATDAQLKAYYNKKYGRH